MSIYAGYSTAQHHLAALSPAAIGACEQDAHTLMLFEGFASHAPQDRQHEGSRVLGNTTGDLPVALR